MAWVSINNYLSESQRQNNATIMYNIFSEWGWSINAICALLGNMEYESSLSPGVVENLATNNPPNKGYGLIQWTDSKATNVHNNPLWKWIYNNYGDYNWSDGDRQCIFINSDDRYNWIPTKNYPLNYADFKVSTSDIDYLTKAYFYNRERGTWNNKRLEYAQKWWDYFGGGTVDPTPPEPPDPPVPPDPPEPEKRYTAMPLYLYPCFKLYN